MLLTSESPARSGSETDHSETASTPWSVLSKNDPASPIESAGHGPVEPIAIVGMSCRLPGSATNTASFWEMLVSGRTAWTPGPGKRFNMEAFQDPTGRRSGTTNAGGGHWLKEDIANFDAAFFGINPVEAIAMDPQQRLILEIAYESFENAGISLDALSGSNTGVFVGQWASDYHEMMTRDTEDTPLYVVTGTGPAITSNRISYVFNLRGPSFTVDTGCSASFVALHQAVQSLRSGETTQCFVGGVNLLLDPQRFHYQSRLKMFSAEGRSFAFDSRANGYGRGEGCTGVVLKPLSSALRDGDNIRAVIRNSVLNQDGRTQGITLPSAVAQREAILKAYQQAHLEPSADYVEAHGTGTKVGDPIEVSAIASVLSSRRASRRKLPIGSVKANIGHTEGAAGLAGLIKAVLMLEHGIIPPQANFEKVNPEIHLDEWNLRIPLQAERRNLRRISVNSFGYGGTNAHVVVDSVMDHRPPVLPALRRMSWPTARVPRVFIVSAASQASCQRMCKKLAKYLVTHQPHTADPDALLARLAYTLTKHSMLSHRVALVASEMGDLVSQLLDMSSTAVAAVRETKASRIAFVFSGQGAQYAEMGRQLLHSRPAFFRALERTRTQLSRLGCRWDLVSELCRPRTESKINDPAYAQPLSTAVQIALVDLLAELDVLPSAVVGHSSGEIAAAYAAGLLSFEDAVTAAYFRGKLTGELIASANQNGAEAGCQGAMLAVGAAPGVVEQHIAKVGEERGRMRIACFNSPASVTVSGDASAVEELAALLESEGVFHRRLMTNGAAYHSHQMEPLASEYASCLTAIRPQPTYLSSVRMFSSVTGEELSEQAVLDGDYWVRNLLNPVLFSQAVKAMSEQRYDGEPIDTIVEVGPHSQLGGPIKQILKTRSKGSADAAYTHTLKRGSDAEESFLRCLGFLSIQGAAVNISDMQSETPALLSDLPPYPFDHDRRFWHESRLSKAYRHRPHLPHELLGTLSIDVNTVEPRWRRFLRVKETPWLQKHIIQGQVVFPAAGYLTMVVQAARQHAMATSPSASVHAVTMRNVNIGKALVLSEDAGDVEIGLSLRPQPRTARESSAIWNEFRIFSVTSTGQWIEHCRGLVCAETSSEGNDEQAALEWTYCKDRVSAISEQSERVASAPRFYALAREAGLEWQDPFDNLCSVRTGAATCLATARAPENETVHPGGLGDVLHPAVLDSVLFQGLCFIAMHQKSTTSALVPTFIKQLRIDVRHTLQGGEELVAASTTSSQGPAYDVFACRKSGTGDMILCAEEIHLTALPGDVVSAGGTSRELCHATEWVTYTEAWTPEHLDRLCKSVVPEGSVAAHNRTLEAETLRYVQKALAEVSPADIPEGSYFHRLFEWMQTLSISNEECDSSSVISESGVPETRAVGEAISRLGPRLPDVLTHKVDPLALLLPDDLLSRLYADDRCQRCYAQMAAWSRELGLQKPGLKVLEIGAGTASTTIPVLSALRGHVGQYDFTDLSSGFFENAKTRLGDLADCVEFKVLNIENAGRQQGFEEASYDLVVASNVLHATRNLDNTLHNVRSLLKPGGRLMLLEVTRDTAYYNVVFGVFEGWWAGYDEGRTLSPLLRRAEWIARLKSCGFAEAEACFEDYAEAEGGTLTTFIATASPSSTASNPLPPVVLVTTDEAKPAAETCLDNLNASLSNLDTQFSATPASVQSVCAPLTGASVAVILPEVATLLSSPVNQETWAAFKAWVLGSRAVLLVSQDSSADAVDPGVGGLWTGFARCLRLEQPEIRIVTLRLQHSETLAVPEALSKVLPTLLSSPTFDLSRDSSDVETEFAEQNGQLFVPRLASRPAITDHIYRSGKLAEPEQTPFFSDGRVLKAELGIAGLLETFRWNDDTAAPALGPDDVKIELRAASINFKDVLIAAGQLEGITEMRNDCSGVVVEVGANMRERFAPGDRVCALYSRSYTNYPVVHGDCCQVIPDSMSFEEGASLPIVWSTVYYSLVDLGRLKSGDKVLIHSAAGAVGQAAIILAQQLGAEVFATVSSPAKRELLQDLYGIPADHIFSSRTTAFAGGIKRLTGGYGVDVVLNSLGGELFRESCNLVARFGRFVEIGRKELMDDALMPMGFMLKNVTFAYVELSSVIEHNTPLARQILQSVVELARDGRIKAVPLTIMPISEIEAAFRLIQAGKHTGKVILRVEDGQQVKAVPPPPLQAKLSPDATYAVVGGFGGLGRAVILWMASHGARNIVGLSRSGGQDEQSRSFIQEMNDQGINVIGKACDVACREQVEGLVGEIEKAGMPPIRGIIQSAMVLRDSLFQDMTADDWNSALAPKLGGTVNLEAVLGEDLDFFIMLSSTVAVCGNIGQSNYAAGCGFQDALARQRVRRGRPAFSINVGPVTDAGFVSENPEVAESLRRAGMGAISTQDLLAAINHSVNDPAEGGCVLGVAPNSNKRGAGGNWIRHRLFARLARRDGVSQREEGESTDIAALLGAAESFDDAVDIMCDAILQQLGKLMATPVEMLSAARSLDSYGVDSLVAVELRNWIGAYLGANVQLMVLRGTSSIHALAKIAAKESSLVCFEVA